MTDSSRMTQHPEGSVRELLTISYPLMLSVLSANLMLFLDRLILSRYDTLALNAVVTASIVCSIFQDGAIGITAITEIFVGHFNGGRQFEKVGASVWQMIWFSLLSLLLFIPLSLFAGPSLIPHDPSELLGVNYFQTSMLFGFLYPLGAALAAFFIGRGRVKFVMAVVIFTNCLNVGLDFILIFGLVPGMTPMGSQGAAWATGCAQLVQVLILFTVFSNHHHRTFYGTHCWRLDREIFTRCLRFGLPGAVSNIVELSAWSILAQMLASVSHMHITVYAIVQSIFALFTFAVSGLQKGLMNLSAYQLSTYNKSAVTKSVVAGVKILIFFLSLLILPLVIYPHPLIASFLSSIGDETERLELYALLTQALRWLWLYFLFDGFSWLMCGVLTAAGDNRFVMIANSLSAWLYSILPSYIFIVYFEGSPKLIWILGCLYALMTTLSYWVRYRSKHWYANILTVHHPELNPVVEEAPPSHLR